MNTWPSPDLSGFKTNSFNKNCGHSGKKMMVSFDYITKVTVFVSYFKGKMDKERNIASAKQQMKESQPTLRPYKIFKSML